MKENERRDGLRSDCASARTEAEALRDRTVDKGAKEWVSRVVTGINDVDTLFLRDGEPHAPLWYDVAEQWLSGERQRLAYLSNLFQTRGGPEKFRTIG